MIITLFCIVAALFTLFTLGALLTVYFNGRNLDRSYEELTVMLGSGGHTGQMCQMLRKLSFQKVTKVNVIVTGNDKNSQIYFKGYVRAFINEALLQKVQFYRTMRTNQVKQSLITAVISTSLSFLYTLRLVNAHLLQTTIFISNGPGTCVPFFIIFRAIAILRRIVRVQLRMKLIFVQSWCRVTSISLTGKIVRYFADNFIVHWKQMKEKYPFAQYYGKLI